MKPKDFLFDWTWTHFPQERIPPLAESLWAFLELLQHENRKVNLTSINDIRDMVPRHLVDTLAPFASPDCPVDPSEPLRAIDIGSGNGVPGLVLALVFPHWRVSLLESNRKKIDFLHQAVNELELGNVELLHGRAETLARQPAHRETFHLALARALAILPTTLELAVPFLLPRGWLLAYKGSDCHKEIEIARPAFQELCAQLLHTLPYALDPLPLVHTALWIQKLEPTSGTYPRRDGMPRKRPLWERRGSA